MKTSYTQCLLKRNNVSHVSYVPTKFASLGAVLKIKGENGWIVTYVGTVVDTQPNVRQQIRRHLDNTGDALPKFKT